MAKNTALGQAKKAKKDEFYTQLSDIENEVMHYKEHFKGKTVFCNCDDPKVSNFFVFFVRNFKEFGLKRLITTCYKNSQYELFSQHDEEHAVMLDYRGGDDNNPDIKKIAATAIPLKGDGDFRSNECIELLKEADIVVTNPPFSLFREYVAQLIKYEKKFLIIGNQNAITYKEIFPLIKDNRMWLGYGFTGGAAHFINNHYEDYAVSSNHQEGMIRVSGVVWFTNLEHSKRHEPLDLYKTYSPEEYPTYDNYDAIEVSKTVNIPSNYYGMMGVPITFMDKYCPEQFEIIWQASGNTRASTPHDILKKMNYRKHPEDRGGCSVIKGKRTYGRIIIQRKKADIL